MALMHFTKYNHANHARTITTDTAVRMKEFNWSDSTSQPNMPGTFTISFQGDPVLLVQRARALAAQNNVQFDGDENSGTFSGNGVTGSYAINDRVVTITITDKPWYVMLTVLENKVRQFLIA